MKKNNNNTNKKANWALRTIVSLVLLCFAIFELYNEGYFTPLATNGQLTITMIDVKQGDSILISQGGKHALIDTNTSSTFENVQDAMRKHGARELEYLIATHPHADHIGSMPDVLETYDVKNYFYTDLDTGKYTYKRAIEFAVEYAENMKIIKRGDFFMLSDVKFTVLSPTEGYSSKEVNNYSAVLLLEYGDFKALFTGDAEMEIEKDLVSKGLPKVDLLKVGHHGSYSSTTKEFLAATRPKIALMSLAKDNEYGFPHQIVLDNLKNIDCQVFRTDLLGDITVIVDQDGTVTVK